MDHDAGEDGKRWREAGGHGKQSHVCRVRRERREMVLFAAHDLLEAAPFSRMDLISCRNLLIYLDKKAQRRVVDIFHFSLRPGGLPLLGASDSADEFCLSPSTGGVASIAAWRGHKPGLPILSDSSTFARVRGSR